MGRRGAADEGARQCRDAGRRARGALVRRRGHRPLPHRAHVLRRRPHRRRARDDPRRQRGRTARGARQAPAHAARRFRRAVRDHGRAAGDHPPARSAAARVPAEDARRRSPRSRRRWGSSRRSSASGRMALHEFNPMLGHRGCRLAISYPEIAEMQARAIFEAAIEVGQRRRRARSTPEIMVPLVAVKAELDRVKALIDAAAAAVAAERGVKAALPRRHHDRAAARRARAPARSPRAAEFFSFGTNDLTQTTFGFSRDDAASFLGAYIAERHPRQRPVRHARPRGRRRARSQIAAERGREDAPRHQARHLRRAWRRPGVDRLLRGGRPRLRLLLALPRAHRPPGRGASRAQGEGRAGRRSEDGLKPRLSEG